MTVGGSLKALGIGTALSYVVARVLAGGKHLAYHRYRIVSVPRTGTPAMPRNHMVRRIDAAELKTFDIDAPLDVQHRRFGHGLVCLGAFEAGVLVGVNWLALGHYDEDEVSVRFLLPDDAAWDTGLWIRPDRRLSRAFAALWAGTADWLAERGLDRSISRIADYNLTSLNSHRRMQGGTIGTMTVLRLGNVQLAARAQPRVTRIGRGEPAIVDLRGWP